VDMARENEAARWEVYKSGFHNRPASEQHRRMEAQRTRVRSGMQRERHAMRDTCTSDEHQRAVNQREADTARRMKHNKYQRDKHTKQERSASWLFRQICSCLALLPPTRQPSPARRRPSPRTFAFAGGAVSV